MRGTRTIAGFVALVVAWVAYGPRVVRAEECIDFARFLHPTATLSVSGSDIDIVGQRAYVSGQSSLLHVVDLTDAASPRLLASVSFTGALDFAFEGNFVYAACDSAGLQIFDLTDPVAPRWLATVDVGEALQVAVSNGRASVLVPELSGFNSARRLVVVDVSNPGSPVLGGSVRAAETTDLIASGLRVWTIRGDLGLHLVDVSRADAPALVAGVNTPGNVSDLDVVGDRVYVADGNGVEILDFTVPRSPVVVGRLEDPLIRNAQHVAAAGNLLGVASGERFCILDVSEPSAPKLLGTHSSAARDVAVANGFAYVTDGVTIRVYPLSTPASPAPDWTLETSGVPGQVSVSGTHGYVLATDGLEVIDLLAAPPRIVGVVSGPIRDVAVAGDRAYALEGNGLQILDFTDPARPQRLGRVESLEGLSRNRVAVSGNYAYVSATVQGEAGRPSPGALYVVDVSDPEAPRVVGSAELEYSGWGLAFSGHYAYVATGYWRIDYDSGGELEVVNLDDPAHPFLAGGIELGFVAENVTVAGDYAWVSGTSFSGYSSRYGQVVAVDILDPEQPKELSGISTSDLAGAVAVSGMRALVPSFSAGLVVVDIANPRAVKRIATIDMPNARGIAVAHAHAYVTDASLRTLRAYPVPCDLSTPVAVSDLEAVAVPAGVRLRWRADAAGNAFQVLRAVVTRIGETPRVPFGPVGVGSRSAGGVWECLDKRVRDGATYAYIVSMEGGEIFGPVWVTVTAVTHTLLSASPNPTASETTLRFDLSAPADVELHVYDVAGRRVRRLQPGRLRAGRQVAWWDGRDETGIPVGSGVYWVRLLGGGNPALARVTVLR